MRSSGQLVNKSKSCFLVAPRTPLAIIQDIKQITGYAHSKFPFTYLGSPIYTGKKLVALFNDLISKIAARIQNWQQGRMLSYGGKAVMIKSVLHSLPIHLLSVV